MKNMEQKLELELTIENALKNINTPTLLIMEQNYGDVKYSKSCEDLRTEYNLIVKELNSRGIRL